MASSAAMVHNMLSISPHSPKCYYKNQTLALTHSNFLSSPSFLRFNRKTLFSNIKFDKPLPPRPLVYALQSNVFKVIQTVLKIGKDGIEAGTDLVPNTVPRPVARISVTFVALSVTLFVLKSVLSTAFFALATMGLVYFVFIALNKDQGPRGGSGSGRGRGRGSGSDSMDDPLEEARKIMEKYK